MRPVERRRMKRSSRVGSEVFVLHKLPNESKMLAIYFSEAAKGIRNPSPSCEGIERREVRSVTYYLNVPTLTVPP